MEASAHKYVVSLPTTLTGGLPPNSWLRLAEETYDACHGPHYSETLNGPLLPHLLRSIRDVVEDLVHGMAVERLLEPLLVEVVPHEADRTTEDEQGVEQTRGDHLGVGELKLLQQIDEEHTDAAIGVQADVPLP